MLSSGNLSNLFHDTIHEHLSVIRQLESQQASLALVADAMSRAIQAGRTIFWCGNGGSAADSQHLAAELVGRFRQERRAIATVALCADSSVVTAVANDYGYDEVFSRQLEGLCSPGDVVIGLSTSGNSVNVCFALQTAHDLGAFTVAMTGDPGGRLSSAADVWLHASSRDTARIQEAHMLCGHVLCEWVEMAVCGVPDLAAAGGAR